MSEQTDTPEVAVPPYPQRRFRLTIDVEGDSVEDIADKLGDLSWQLNNRPAAESTFGGVSVGGHWSLTENEGQTNDRYFEQLSAWRAADEKRRAEGTVTE